jgi:hypothetical protein
MKIVTLPTQELQESWARLVPFGSIPTERHFKTFFEASDARDFSGPADSQTRSQRFMFPCKLSQSRVRSRNYFRLILSTGMLCGIASGLKVVIPLLLFIFALIASRVTTLQVSSARTAMPSAPNSPLLTYLYSTLSATFFPHKKTPTCPRTSESRLGAYRGRKSC